jgi:hypothetical protein
VIEDSAKLSVQLALALIGLVTAPLVPLYLSSTLVARQTDSAGRGQDTGEDLVPRLLTGYLCFAKEISQPLVLACLDKLGNCAPPGLASNRSSQVRPALFHSKPCPYLVLVVQGRQAAREAHGHRSDIGPPAQHLLPRRVATSDPALVQGSGWAVAIYADTANVPLPRVQSVKYEVFRTWGGLLSVAHLRVGRVRWQTSQCHRR